MLGARNKEPHPKGRGSLLLFSDQGGNEPQNAKRLDDLCFASWQVGTPLVPNGAKILGESACRLRVNTCTGGMECLCNNGQRR